MTGQASVYAVPSSSLGVRPTAAELEERVHNVRHGFTDIKQAAREAYRSRTPGEATALAHELFRSHTHQVRMLAVFIFGMAASDDEGTLRFLREDVSRDSDWRVQEILAQAFDLYCAAAGYKEALPVIRSWLADPTANVRRAATEGLRIWTTRPYFKDNPQTAVSMLAALRDDESEYVRKSAGNALRDISRQHAALVSAEVACWDLADKRVAHTYELASKFLERGDGK